MEVKVIKAGNGTRYCLSGTLSHSDNAAFNAIIEDCGSGAGRVITLDMADLKHVDSFGLGLIMVAWDDATRVHNRFELRNATGRVHMLVDLAGLSSLLHEGEGAPARSAAAPVKAPPAPPIAEGLALHVSHEPDQVVVEVRGRFTFTDHAAFLPATALVVKSTTPVVFDFSRLEFMDSAALGMILIARDEAEKSGCALSIRGARGRVRKLLELADLSKIMDVTDG